MTLHYTAIVILPILRRSNDNGDELGSAYRVGDPRDRSIRHIIAWRHVIVVGSAPTSSCKDDVVTMRYRSSETRPCTSRVSRHQLLLSSSTFVVVVLIHSSHVADAGGCSAPPPVLLSRALSY